MSQSRAVLLFLAVLTFCAGTLSAQVQSTPRSVPENLDFEGGAAGELPPGWTCATKGFDAKTVEGDVKEGKKAANVRALPDAGPDASRFGNLMQTVDASPYRGHWVRLRGAVKLTGEEDGHAQPWLRIDRPEKQIGFFDSMSQHPIYAREWTYFEIMGDVAADATTLNFGLMFVGTGGALVDDVSVTDLGKVEMTIEPACAATERGLDNLVAFAKLLGYVRHFHPSDQAAATDWNRFAVEGVRAVEGAPNPTELAKKLDAILRPVAPTVQIYTTGHAPKKNDRLPRVADRDDIQIVSWKHLGFGQPDSFPYKSERIRTDAPSGRTTVEGPDPRKPLEVDLGGGVSARIPLAVYADKTHTLPALPVPVEKLAKFSGDDRATRLATTMLAWNVMEHFYPYFDVVKTDWNAQLRPTLKAAATDADQKAFLPTIRRMIAQLHDGHGSVYLPSDSRGYVLPLFLAWAEEKLVITYVADEKSGLKAGDVIEQIDGRPSLDWLRQSETMISSATPQFARYRAMGDLRMGTPDSAVALVVRTGTDEPRAVRLTRSMRVSDLRDEPRPPKLGELEPGIWYIDLGRISDADFEAALPRLAEAKGAIFDLRGYPASTLAFMKHLSDKPLQSPQWLVPIVTRPDHVGMDWDRSGRWDLQPLAPRVGGTLVFLTDGRAISYAESVMGIIEAYHVAEIVGEPTAGTNGNVNPIVLPGGYSVVWTGMQVRKNDGSTHHGVGILPTVPVSRTIRGITEKRDEQLERAVAIVKGKKE